VRRRRLLLGATAAGILVALALPWGGAGGHTLATPGPVLAGATVAHHTVYVVQPGDTLWTIAERLDPDADPRSVVAELQAQIGTDTVQPGERLQLP
jgi:LysM repeat protein